MGLASGASLRYLEAAVPVLRPALLLAALALVSSGCDGRADASTPDAAPPPPPAPSARPAPPPPAPSASSTPEKPPLQLLKLVFTSEVKNREPVDKLDHAQPGQRVWVHLTLRNRGADVRPISVGFQVNGDARTRVDLKVDPSWSYRTWAYNTLRAGDAAGELVVDVRDDAGTVVTTARLPIKTDAGKTPPSRPVPLGD